jgi:hypothetical protein
MDKKAPKCKYCKNTADFMDYREVDGVVSKIPSCKICQGYSNNFHYNPDKDEKIRQLIRQIEWYNNFANAVQWDHRTYDNACEYADEQEIEKYGPDYSGEYSSVNDFIDRLDLEGEAEELFGEDWEVENDIEQIQALVGDGFIVKEIEPTSEREKRVDNYIQVIKK